MIKYEVRVLDNGTKKWCLNGKRHREDRPAIEYPNKKRIKKVFNMKTLVILCILSLLAVSCSLNENTEWAWERVGKIVDVSVVPTSFNESFKMIIKTEKLVVVICGHPSVEIGAEAYILTAPGKQKRFNWDDHDRWYRVH